MYAPYSSHTTQRHISLALQLLCFLFASSLALPTPSHAQDSKPRHVIVSVDVSKSMWSGIKPNNHRKAALLRLHAILAEILFSTDPILPSQNDQIVMPGKVPRPLLRAQDFLSLSLFGNEFSTLFLHQPRNSVSERIFREKLPDPATYWKSMKDRYSLIAIAKTQALRDLERYTNQTNYLVLVTDDVDDGGLPGSDIFRRSQEAKESLERELRNKSMQPIFSIRVQKHISIRLYLLQHTEKTPAEKTPTPAPIALPAPVILKVEPILAQPTSEGENIVQKVRINSPTEWKQHQLKSVQYVVSHNDQPIAKQLINLNQKLDQPQTTIPITIPKNKVHETQPFQVVMKLQFLSPTNQTIEKEAAFSFPAISKPNTCQKDTDCPQKPTPQTCKEQRCIAQTSSGSDDSIILLLVSLSVIIVFSVVAFAVFRAFSSSSKSVMISVRFESPSQQKHEIFTLAPGSKVYLAERNDGQLFFDIHAPNHVLEWKKDHMLIHLPDGEQKELPFQRPFSLFQGQLIIENTLHEASEEV